MESDRSMAIINQKAPCEVPQDWLNVIENARVKPSPFQVIDVDYIFFRNLASLLDPY